MKSITISDELADELLKAEGEVVDVIDVHGKLVGLFRRNLVLQPPYDLEDLPSQSEEDFAKDLAEGPLMTTEEVLRSLRGVE